MALVSKLLHGARWLANTIPVLIVLFLVLWTLRSYVLNFCLHLFAVNSRLEGTVYLIVYHALCLLFLSSYLRCSFERPLSVEPGTSYCKKCKIYRKERTHHCSMCRKCITKFDHHCPWVGNCIGAHNYKYFILMLFYSVLLSLFITTTLFFDTQKIKSASTFTFIAVIFAIFISTSILFCFHIYLLLTNSTTLEFGILCAESCEARMLLTNQYNCGVRNNIRSVFGDFNIYYFIPTKPIWDENSFVQIV